MSDIKIRLVKKEDINTFVNCGLIGLLEFCNGDDVKKSTMNYHNQHKNKTMNFLTKIIDNDFGQFNKMAWVAVKNDEVIGTIILQPIPRKPINDKKSASINNVYVKHEFRGTGLAQRLLETVEKHCITNNILNINLITQNNLTRAVSFYEKQGYVKTRQSPWQSYILLYYNKPLQLNKKRKR